MTMKKTCLATLVAAIAALAYQPLVAGEKVIKNGDKIVFMGDSITHYGVERSHGYVNLTVQGLAANGINVNWAGRGVPGEKASQMRARFQRDVLDLHPDVVTIAAGVNDVLIADAAPASSPADVEWMITTAIANGIKPVVMTPTFAQFSAENSDVTSSYAETVRGFARTYGIPLGDNWQAVTDWKNDATKPYLEYQLHYKETIDGVHMAPSGDRVMARTLLRAMGLNDSEMAKAEAAWNANERIYPVNPAVKITPAQLSTFKQAAANAGVGGGEFAKTVFKRGLASLAQRPSVESNYSGSDGESFSAGFSINMADYDQLLTTSMASVYQPADKNKGHVDATIAMAMLRGLRECEAGEPVVIVPQDVKTNLFSRSIAFTTSGYTGSSTLTDFPVAVRLAANSPAGFSYADMADSTSGKELRFADAAGKSLDYEVENWDASGTSLVWVKLPTLTKRTTFTMYYGGKPTDDVTASRTWSADYVGVWHMSEENGAVSDSSGNGLSASVEQAVDGLQSAGSGIFGKARVNSSNRNHTSGRALLKVSDSYLLDLGNDFTLSSWVKMTSTTDGSVARIACRGADGGGSPEWEVGLTSDSAVKVYGGSGSTLTGTIPSVLNNWVHLVTVYNGTTLTVYANGTKAFEGAISAVKDSNNKLCFGSKGGVFNGHFTGLFDEFRLRDAACSADWVKAEYDQAGTSFLSTGAVSEQEPDPGEGDGSGSGEGTGAGEGEGTGTGAGEGTGSGSGEGTGSGAGEDGESSASGALVASGDKTGATDTAAIQSALDAAKASKGTVTLGNGIFYLNAQLTVGGGETLSGQGWGKTTLRQVGSDRVLTVSGGSTVKNLTITGGRYSPSGNYKFGGGVLVEKGTVSWCRVVDNSLTCGNSGYGGGVGFTGPGKIDHSIISGNSVTTTSEYVNGGGGIGTWHVAGEVVIESCLISDNVVAMSKGHLSGRGGAIGADCAGGTTLTVRNTTIVGNAAGKAGGDNSANGGAVYTESDSNKKLTMVNCIFANNTTYGKSNLALSSSDGVTYCLFDQAADNPGGTGCKVGSPKFVNAAADDYSLASDSPAKSAGISYTGIGLDLAGNAFAATPSLGCYEYGSASGGDAPAPGGDEGTGGEGTGGEGTGGEGTGDDAGQGSGGEGTGGEGTGGEGTGGEGSGDQGGSDQGGQEGGENPPIAPTGDFKKAITFTTSGYRGTSTLENFPVLVKLSTAINGFDYADFGGTQNLVFKDAQGNVLPHEIEAWDVSGTSLVWVKLPAVTKTTTFTLYYSGSAADGNASGNAWTDGDYVGVWHMAEADGDAVDATGHGLTAMQKGTTTSAQVSTAGAIGTARVSATSSSKTFFEVANNALLNVGDTFTVSGWYNLSTVNAASTATVVGRQGGWFSTDGWLFELDKSDTTFYVRGASNSSNNMNAKGAMPSALNTWVHFALVYNGASVTVYANGVPVSTTGSINAAKNNSTSMMFGYASTRGYLYGSFDELRLRDAVSSADWVKAEYDQAGASFLANGGAQSVGEDTPAPEVEGVLFYID